MKKSELIFNLVSIPSDALMLLCAAIASFYLRQNSTSVVGPIKFQLVLADFLIVAVVLIPFLLVLFALFGLYNLRGTRKVGFEFSKIFLGVSFGLLIVIILFFFDQSIFPSRFIILATWILGVIFTFFGRLTLRSIQRFLFSKNIGLHKIVIIRGKLAETELVLKYYKDKSNGYSILKELDYSENCMRQIIELNQTQGFDELLQTNPFLTEDQNLEFLKYLRSHGKLFSYVPNLFDVQKNVIETQVFQGTPVISLKNSPLDGWGKIAKRVIDILASFICLVLTSPVFLLVAILIKLDSKGRIVYSAFRGGQGRDFMFYKFRTMFTHMSVGKEFGGETAEQLRKQLWEKNDRGGAAGPFLKIKHDPRVTSVGRFLRRTKLDEIPQFWNVLKGDMSMVGPRAHVLDEVERYRQKYPRMFSIKPGIFGLSQIAQVNLPNLPFEEEIRLNTYYIENWSLWLDVKILIQSFFILLFAHKVNDDY